MSTHTHGGKLRKRKAEETLSTMSGARNEKKNSFCETLFFEMKTRNSERQWVPRK
jgi:hypothetical protein